MELGGLRASAGGGTAGSRRQVPGRRNLAPPELHIDIAHGQREYGWIRDGGIIAYRAVGSGGGSEIILPPSGNIALVEVPYDLGSAAHREVHGIPVGLR